MKSKLVVLGVSALFLSPAWADMFCPNNFNSVNVGDSLETVINACGKPDSKTTNNHKAEQPQEWGYYIATDPTKPGTMKLTVAFDASGKAINISVNGSGMPQTQLCANGQIELGDSMDAVSAACGKATFVNQTLEAQKSDVPETEMVEITYNATPPVTFVFENGRLTQRK